MSIQASTERLLETRGPREKIAFIFNPASGTEDPLTRRARLEALAEAAGIPGKLVETDERLGASPLAEEAVRDGVERVLVSGGDGTVTEAAGALAGTRAALAVIPGGTGNLLAVNLGIPTEPDAAVDLALNGEPRPIDVGRANGKVFLIMAGIGADARMIRDADRNLKRRLGALAYFVAAWRNLGRPCIRYTIIIDGRRIRRSAQTVLIANMGKITGGVELVPQADPENGLLEVAIFRARSFRDVALVALRALLGQIRSDDLLEIRRARHVTIRTRSPQPVQIDGNDVGTTDRLEAHIEPRALWVVRPSREEMEQAALLLPPIVRHTLPPIVPLAAGVGAGVALARQAKAARERGETPGVFARHPVAGALGVWAATVIAGVLWLRRRPRPPTGGSVSGE